MKRYTFFSGLTVFLLTACAAPEPKQNLETVITNDELSALVNSNAARVSKKPPRHVLKNGKPLDLVRIMDGGICKNDYQGVKGEFLIYASTRDIDRIKEDKGSEVFARYEVQIQDFSKIALEQAVEETNLAEDPFALDADEAQEKLSRQLTASFKYFVNEAINKFIAKTSLTIDIIPYAPSLVFFQHGCESSEVESEQ